MLKEFRIALMFDRRCCGVTRHIAAWWRYQVLVYASCSQWEYLLSFCISIIFIIYKYYLVIWKGSLDSLAVRFYYSAVKFSTMELYLLCVTHGHTTTSTMIFFSFFAVVCLFWLCLFCFVWGIVLNMVLFGGTLKEQRGIWKDGEISRIGVHKVKSTKNQ